MEGGKGEGEGSIGGREGRRDIGGRERGREGAQLKTKTLLGDRREEGGGGGCGGGLRYVRIIT